MIFLMVQNSAPRKWVQNQCSKGRFSLAEEIQRFPIRKKDFYEQGSKAVLKERYVQRWQEEKRNFKKNKSQGRFFRSL